MMAGTSSIRTTVASTHTATAGPTPKTLITGVGLNVKPRNTAIMMIAAAEMTPPVSASLRVTASFGVAPRSQALRAGCVPQPCVQSARATASDVGMWPAASAPAARTSQIMPSQAPAVAKTATGSTAIGTGTGPHRR